MKRLIADRMIEVVRHTNKFTVYRLTNFEKFNSQEVAKTVALSLSINSQPTGKQQSVNSQSTTNEEGTKKVKKDRNVSISFDAFWVEYPKKDAKADCIKLWAKIDESEHPAIMAGVMAYKKSKKVLEGFVMGPDKWLRGRRWEDEYEGQQSIDWSKVK
jgi:hypothetical protein